MATLFVSIVSIVAIATLLAEPVYEANAQVLVKVGRENLYTPTTVTKVAAEPKFFSDNQEAQTNSEAEILKSRILAINVIMDIGIANIYPKLVNGEKKSESKSYPTAISAAKKFFGIPVRAVRIGNSKLEKQDKGALLDTAVDLFQKSVHIEGIKKTNVIHIVFQHTDRKMAVKALDLLLNKYLDLHLQIYKKSQSIGFFQDQSLAKAEEVQNLENALTVFKQKHSIYTSPEERLDHLIKEESELRNVFNKTVSEMGEVEGRLKKLRPQIAKIPNVVMLEHEEADNPPGILQNRLTELEAKRSDLLSRYQADNILIQINEKDILEVLSRLEEQERKKIVRERSGLNNLHQKIQEELLQNEATYQALNRKKDIIEQQLESYQRKIKATDANVVEYNQLLQRLEIARKGYISLLTEFEESRISQAMDLERITNLSILDPAHAAPRPVKPKKMLNLVLSLFLGSLASLGAAFLLEYLNKTYENPEDIEGELGVPVLVSIPDALFEDTSAARA